MRFVYKPSPVKPNPDIADLGEVWDPILSVRISYPRKHTRLSHRFDAHVDSGCPYTYIQASIGRSLGIPIEKGKPSWLGGIVKEGYEQVFVPVFFHEVILYFAGESVQISVGFCDDLTVSATLGRNGFFDNYKVTFDHSRIPPEFEIERIKAH